MLIDGITLDCHACGSITCLNHHGAKDLKCVNCTPEHECCRVLDIVHGGSSAKAVKHGHICSICGEVYTHTHDLARMDNTTHPMVCPQCSRQAVSYSPVHHRYSPVDLAKLTVVAFVVLLTVGFFAWFLPSVFMGVFTPIKTALVTVNNVTAESGEVIRDAAHLVGTQLKKTIASLGENEQQIQETVLHVTKVASLLASQHLNRTTLPLMSAANGLSVLTGDFLELASEEIRQSCWIVACLFLSRDKCNEQYYTEFHLCDNPVYKITERGVEYSVTAPCRYNGAYITTDATKRYNTYVKTRVYAVFEKEVSNLSNAGTINAQTFNNLANSMNLYQHIQLVAREECDELKPYMRKDCNANHCIDLAVPRALLTPEKLTYACLLENWNHNRKMFAE